MGDYYQPPQEPIVSGQPGKPEKHGLQIASLVLGIVALALWCIWWISIPCGILSIVFAIVCKNANKLTGMRTAMATAGMVLGIIGLGISILVVILAIAGMASFLGNLGNYSSWTSY